MSESRKIVVGVDASPESATALEWATTFAGPDDRIAVVHAWDIPMMTGYDMVVAVDVNEIEQLAKQGLDEFVEKADDERLVPVLAQGHAGRAIVAEGEDADLIVVGHRGNSRLSLMLGSTANYVVHHAPSDRPIVVVRGEKAGGFKRVVVGVDDFDDPEDNPSVRALRWAYDLPGVEHVGALHAWFLPPLAVGVFHDVSSEMSAMDDAAQRVAERVVAAAGPAPEGVLVTAETARGTGSFALIEA
ncbi:MAG: universal stress protein, partial [Ilumatobacter sp.]|nr:universal stress protein [Ilumatobacter sp.]